MGILGLLLMISAGSGLYLWWPGLRGIWQGLKIRHNPGMLQLVFDLHRMTGLLSAAALLLLAFTGFLLSYPSVTETLIGSSGMAHGETGRNITSTAVPNDHPTNLEAAEFMARGPFQRAELRRITTPIGEDGVYRINLRQDSEINQRHPFTTVWVDRWSGQIKEVRDPSGFTQGEIFMTWIWPMHTGEAFGATGRLLWFLAGMGLFVLYVSGLLRWLYRHGKIKDREVNFTAVRTLFYWLQKMVCRTGLALFRLAGLLLQRAKRYAPQAMKGCATLLQWLRSVIDQQKQV